MQADGPAWRAPLTRRHAEILSLLHGCGRGGLTAGQLSNLRYGDGAHVVTVRAEISRMRRVIGALISSNPYRLAAGVQLSIASGAAGT